MGWRIKAVAIGTSVVAVAALAGFAVKVPAQVAASSDAASARAAAGEREWTGVLEVSSGERAVAVPGVWTAAEWAEPVRTVLASADGFASEQTRIALAADIDGLDGLAGSGASALRTPLATAVFARSAQGSLPAPWPIHAALQHGAEAKALASGVRASLDQARSETVARAQTVLDLETPDADPAAREALAAALAVPALAPGSVGPATPQALTALLAATRAAQDSQTAVAAARAAEAAAASAAAGSGSGSSSGGTYFLPLTPEQEARMAEAQRRADQDMLDSFLRWREANPPLPLVDCAQDPAACGY